MNVPLSMGILQARILECAAMPFSRGSSQPRDRTQVSCIAGRFFSVWATREAPELFLKGFTYERPYQDSYELKAGIINRKDTKVGYSEKRMENYSAIRRKELLIHMIMWISLKNISLYERFHLCEILRQRD